MNTTPCSPGIIHKPFDGHIGGLQPLSLTARPLKRSKSDTSARQSRTDSLVRTKSDGSYLQAHTRDRAAADDDEHESYDLEVDEAKSDDAKPQPITVLSPTQAGHTRAALLQQIRKAKDVPTVSSSPKRPLTIDEFIAHRQCSGWRSPSPMFGLAALSHESSIGSCTPSGPSPSRRSGAPSPPSRVWLGSSMPDLSLQAPSPTAEEPKSSGYCLPRPASGGDLKGAQKERE